MRATWVQAYEARALANDEHNRRKVIAQYAQPLGDIIVAGSPVTGSQRTGDGARLFHAALTAENVGHTIVYGSSANTGLGWDLSTARALGYAPQDDSERYAPELLAEHGELAPDDREHTRLGGHFTTRPPMWPH